MSFGYAVYFTERSKNRVVRWEPDTGEVDLVAGVPADGDPEQLLSDPYALAFDKQGTLHVTDKLHHRICSVKNGTLRALPFKDTRGTRGRRSDTAFDFNPIPRSPTGIFAEPSGSFLCTYSDDYTIYRVYPDGDLELILGIPPNRSYMFTRLRESVPASQLPETPVHGPTGLVKRKDGKMFFIERRPQVLRELDPSKGLRCVFPYSQYPEFSRRRAAPDRCPTQDYHPAFPGSLALDDQDALYMTEVHHNCVLRVDSAPGGEIEKVIEIPAAEGHLVGGVSALAFGPDGTAWILNATDQAVEGYEPTTQGLWKRVGPRLTSVRGLRVGIKHAGGGIVAGN
jgi:streptogramin lyase